MLVVSHAAAVESGGAAAAPGSVDCMLQQSMTEMRDHMQQSMAQILEAIKNKPQ
jgi:hypothetical protein